MRILFLSVNYWPEETGIGPVCTWRCEQLAARGHDVTVCTTFPYYPEWRVGKAYRGKLWHRERRNGVSILRSWTWVPRRLTSAKRMGFELSFLAANLLRAWGACRPDVVVIESPPLGLGITATLLSRCWGVPYVFDVMDLQPDTAAELGMLRDGRLIRTLYRMERFAYRHAALVSTLSERMLRRIVNKGVAADDTAVFPVQADPALFEIVRGEGQEFRRAHGLEGKFLVVHCGNMGVKQGLGVVVDAAGITRRRSDIHYLLVGDGAGKAVLQARVAAQRLSNVTILPVQPGAAFRQILATADLSLVTQQRMLSDIVFPSKTVSLFAAGCPVVASINDASEVARIMRESGGGVVVEPENPRQLADAVLALKNPGKLAVMSAAARQYAREHWNGFTIVQALESELCRICGRVSNPISHPVLLGS